MRASISVILKKDKDAEECSSYRPISLLNVDFKIAAKILARRLEKILPKLIDPDQTGFVKARFGSDNLRRVLNIVNHLNVDRQSAIIASLYAYKAFDRVDYRFLFAVLEKVSLGHPFIKLVRLLYSNPMATVSTNGLLSESFPIGRGCRQGCPLSPLLFALVIEPLAELELAQISTVLQ